ncbi:MAG TPA: helix-turn-helix transcriptional regulator [Candidatus Polarisedimenticolaceae bacterium]|jgi:transcriptional regulator with XRE-family HTH domain|nr:helix-turn-helix transcriptional regulator [Candidatus Polarisedimenticolaceae bacterium]
MSARPVRRRQTIFVGSKIRQLRKERSLTQAELAQRIGVQQSDLCRMENGEYKVSLDTLFKILGVFGIDIGEFFREDPASAGPADREREVLRLFGRLDPGTQEEALDFLRFKCSRTEAWRD